MPAMTGKITVVQEGRFRLATADGRSALFVLAHDAPMAPEDLPALLDRSEPITVHFGQADDRFAQLAFDITEPDRPPHRHFGYRGLRTPQRWP